MIDFRCESFQEGVKSLEENSAALVICDPLYGSTRCPWDVRIPFEEYWDAVYRVLAERRAAVFHGSQPFMSLLVCSNISRFSYPFHWNKKFAANFSQAKRTPLYIMEDIAIFSTEERKPLYFPQKTIREKPIQKGGNKQSEAIPIARTKASEEFGKRKKIYKDKYPTNYLEYNVREEYGDHPTPKPPSLYEYLIRTYTKEGELIVDLCCGAGPAGIAAYRTSRDYVGFDISEKYIEKAKNRLEREIQS